MNSSTGQNTIGTHTQWHRRAPAPSYTLPHSHVHLGVPEALTRGTVALQKTTIAAATSTSQTLEQCVFRGRTNYTLSTVSFQRSRLQNTLLKSHKNLSDAWSFSHYQYESAYSTQQSWQFKNLLENHHPTRTSILHPSRGHPQRVPCSFTCQHHLIPRHRTSHEPHHASINDTRASTLLHLRPRPHPQQYPEPNHCQQLHPL